MAKIKMHLLVISSIQIQCVAEFLLITIFGVCALIIDLHNHRRAEFFAVALIGVGLRSQMPALATAGAFTVNDGLGSCEGDVVGGGVAGTVGACCGRPTGNGRTAVLVPGERGGVDWAVDLGCGESCGEEKGKGR